jgi:uncharacterized membrane protein
MMVGAGEARVRTGLDPIFEPELTFQQTCLRNCSCHLPRGDFFRGGLRMTLQMDLLFSMLAFIGTHFLLSHPLRAPLVRAVGERPFTVIYSLVAFVTFGAAIWFYRRIGREPPLWSVDKPIWIASTLLMWLGSVLYVGSFIGKHPFSGANVPKGAPHGIFTITRNPMLWGLAIWAIVHMAVVATPKALVLDGGLLFLAFVGGVIQDRKKQAQHGEAWRQWSAQTSFWPFGRGLKSPGALVLISGTIVFIVATWLHPGHAAGPWR